MYEIGKMILDGCISPSTDENEVIEYLQKAVDNGCLKAMYKMMNQLFIYSLWSFAHDTLQYAFHSSLNYVWFDFSYHENAISIWKRIFQILLLMAVLDINEKLF